MIAIAFCFSRFFAFIGQKSVCALSVPGVTNSGNSGNSGADEEELQ